MTTHRIIAVSSLRPLPVDVHREPLTRKTSTTMATSISLTHPLPLFYHPASERVFYVAHGPSPLVFTIPLHDVTRHALITQEPVLQPTVHPFGLCTGVSSLAETPVRRALAEAEDMASSVLDEALSLWTDFCDALAERLHEGNDLTDVLETTWVLEDAADVDMHEDTPAVVG